MKKLLYSLLIIVSTLSFYACDSDNPVPDNSPYDIYIGGQKTTSSNYSNTAGFWKNGIWNKAENLNTTIDSSVESIAVNGENVYISGSFSPEGPQLSERLTKPGYWRNNELTELNIPATSSNSSAKSINFAGEDIYLAGLIRINNCNIAGYWINSTWHNLTPENSTADSIAYGVAFNGNETYICGAIVNPTLNTYKAGYWKNGNWHALDTSNDLNHSFAKQIIIENGSIYIYGYKEGVNAGYWKDDNWNLVCSELYFTKSMFVTNGDVYITGSRKNDENIDIPGYWRNSEWNELPTTGYNAYASSIFVINDDIFVAGYRKDSTNIEYAGYWLNKTWIPICDTYSSTSAIIVKAKR